MHFVSIYSLMRDPTIVPNPLTEHALTTALAKIEALTAEARLPFVEKLTRKEKTERLTAMLSEHTDH